MKSVAGAAMSAYQQHISREYNGTRGVQCAYHTSCSGYAKETFKSDGLSGLPQVVARLRRCTSENTAGRLSDFLRYAVNCPEKRLGEFFEFSDEDVKKSFQAFRRETLQGASQLAGHQDEAGLKTIESALDNLLKTTHFTVVEMPGAPRSQSAHFRLNPRRHAAPTMMADRGKLANAVRSTASVVTGAASALAGGLAGAVIGTALGGAEGLASGLGLRTTIESWANEKYGVGSLGGTTPLRKLTQKIYDKTQRALGLEFVSNLVGGTVGLVLGLVGGAAGGLAHGGNIGWDMGRVFGRSVADQKLSGFEARGMMEVAPVAIPHSEMGESDPVPVRAQRLWTALATVPEPFREVTRPVDAPAWQFAVFADATPSDLESQEIRQVMEFERNLPPGTSARIHVRRSGVLPPKLRKLLPWAKLGASAVSLAMVGGISGGALLPVLLARTASLGVSAQAVKELVLDNLSEKEPAWTGHRVYELSQRVQAPQDHIHTQPHEHHPGVDPVGATQLADDLCAAFPHSGPRVAVFSGHGESYEKIAGYQPAALGQALNLAYEKTGKKTDLVVLEGCYTGTLEALRPLANGARYALVSQLPVHKVGLPWHHILRNLDDLGQDPVQLGTNLVQLVGGQAAVPSLSLIDLQEVENLTRELEKLAVQIPAEKLAKALPAGDLIGSRDEGVGKQLLRKLRQWLPGSHSGDLQAILASLETPELSEQVGKVRECLEKVVVTARGSGLGGLSVETNAPMFDRHRYQSVTGMSQWGAALASTQPTLLKPVARLASWANQAVDQVASFLSRAWYGEPRGSEKAPVTAD